jgi:hypothetical protein
VLADGKERNSTVQVGESSSSVVNAGAPTIWKKLWGLDCSPKIKQFSWRLAHNSLATKMNLKSEASIPVAQFVCALMRMLGIVF